MNGISNDWLLALLPDVRPRTKIDYLAIAMYRNLVKFHRDNRHFNLNLVPRSFQPSDYRSDGDSTNCTSIANIKVNHGAIQREVS